MKEFDVTVLEKIELCLLKPQIDLVLKCLQYYTYNVYTIGGQVIDEEKNSERCLIADTYSLILKQIQNKKKKKVDKENIFTKLA